MRRRRPIGIGLSRTWLLDILSQSFEPEQLPRVQYAHSEYEFPKSLATSMIHGSVLLLDNASGMGIRCTVNRGLKSSHKLHVRRWDYRVAPCIIISIHESVHQPEPLSLDNAGICQGSASADLQWKVV